MHKIYKCFYVILFILPFFLFLLVPIRGQKETSATEARTLNKIPAFSVKSFIKGEYQEQLELAISDQLLFSNSIKKNNIKITSKSTSVITKVVKPRDKCSLYISVYDGYYKYGCSDYIIEKGKTNYTFLGNKDTFNSITIPKYIYFIEKDRSIDFNHIKEKGKVYESIKDNYQADDYGRFEINSFDDYKKYFYQTDHHWNKDGQLKGYQDIINLLLGEDEETLSPISERTYDVIFYGSSDRKMQTKYSKEKFSVYKYPELKYDVYVDGKSTKYSNHDLYDNNTFKKTTYYNHYAAYYGGDYAEVMYNFHQPDKKNLLVLSTSYSNAINDLVASHFNKTYYIDTRHYKDFDVNKYIKEHNIDMVLMMGDITSFAGGGE